MNTADAGAATAAPQLPGPRLRIAIALMVVGVALAVPTFIAGVIPIVRTVTALPRFTVPGQAQVHLGRGTYMLYEDRGATSLGAAFSHDDSVTITPADVTVVAPDGSQVTVFDRGDERETLNSDDDRYVGAARFTTPTSGEYTVSVRSAIPTRVLIARPLTDTIRSVVGWFALTGLGFVVFMVGIVLLIVGSVRRNRVRSAFAYASQSPPGWYPDPGGSGRVRYWDGYRWTEHLQ